MEANKNMEKAFWVSFQKAFSKGFTAVEAVGFAFLRVMYIPKRIYYYLYSDNNIDQFILEEFHMFFISMFGEQSEDTYRKVLESNRRSNSSIDDLLFFINSLKVY